MPPASEPAVVHATSPEPFRPDLLVLAQVRWQVLPGGRGAQGQRQRVGVGRDQVGHVVAGLALGRGDQPGDALHLLGHVQAGAQHLLVLLLALVAGVVGPEDVVA